jgi:hypothetical protein
MTPEIGRKYYCIKWPFYTIEMDGRGKNISFDNSSLSDIQDMFKNSLPVSWLITGR